MINLDTNTAIAFVAEGSTVRHRLRAFVQDQQLVMAQTAFDEFVNIVKYSGGSLEQARANRFLQQAVVMPDNPSIAAQALQPTRSLDVNDIIILVFCQEFFDGLQTLKKHTSHPSQLWVTHQLKVDRLLGTGDQLGLVTMTADARAVRAASAQGVDFNVYLHRPYSLTGS